MVNCVKPDSLFNAGMLPLVYSTKEVARTGLGWRRMGHNVCYYQNHIKRRTGYYYTASFQVTARQPATSHLHLHHHLLWAMTAVPARRHPLQLHQVNRCFHLLHYRSALASSTTPSCSP